MRVLGISGSPRRGSTTDRLVQAVLSGVQGCETEFVSLSGKHIGPCIACLGCVRDNLCKVKDDLSTLRPKIVEADAYVIGGANYFNALNGLTHCFMERWYQFRHQEGNGVSGKLGVAVGVGGSSGEKVVERSIELFGGMIGPFCLESIVTDDLRIKVFEISSRIVAGTNPFISGSPYSDLLELDVSTGRRIAQEIKFAKDRDVLSEVLS